MELQKQVTATEELRTSLAEEKLLCETRNVEIRKLQTDLEVEKTSNEGKVVSARIEEQKKLSDKIKELTDELNESKHDHSLEMKTKEYEYKKMERDLKRDLSDKDKEIEQLSTTHESVVNTHIETANDLKERMKSMVEDMDTRVNRAIQDEQIKHAKYVAEAEAEKAKQISVHSKELALLQSEIHLLKTPMGRGNSGEKCFEELMEDEGDYEVIDTSNGEYKIQGHLDFLLVHKESKLRLGVEIKNKNSIKKSSDKKRKEEKEDDDINKFRDNRVPDGIRNDLFDGALFISIRSHNKMDKAVAFDFYEDQTKRPIIPVSIVGTRKGKDPPPLTDEEIVIHVKMMFSVLEQSSKLRNQVYNGLKTEEMDEVQRFFESIASTFDAQITTFRQMEKNLEEQRDHIVDMRVQVIKTFEQACSINTNIPWLRRDIEPKWMNVYKESKEKMENEEYKWNSLSNKKSVIETTIGKDALEVVIGASKRQKK